MTTILAALTVLGCLLRDIDATDPNKHQHIRRARGGHWERDLAYEFPYPTALDAEVTTGPWVQRACRGKPIKLFNVLPDSPVAFAWMYPNSSPEYLRLGFKWHECEDYRTPTPTQGPYR